jgi:hypothetical protein
MNGCTSEALPVFSSGTQRECHHRVRTPTCTHPNIRDINRNMLFTHRILPDSPKLIPQKLIASVSVAGGQIWGFKTGSTCGIAAKFDCPEVPIVYGKSDGCGIPPRCPVFSSPVSTSNTLSKDRSLYSTKCSTIRHDRFGLKWNRNHLFSFSSPPCDAITLPPRQKTEQIVQEKLFRM